MTTQPAFADTPNVVTDIAPVHSIVSSVLQGVAEPTLIIPPGASPHGYALRPSEASALAEADVVIWVGPGLTPWLEQPLDALAPDARRLTLTDAPGMTLLSIREGGPFEAHEHGHDHGEADHDDGHDDDVHGEAEHADEAAHEHEHEHEHEHDHAEGETDPHVWLDPANAAAIAEAVAATLTDLDPENATIYAGNAEEFTARIRDLEADVADRLQPAAEMPFFVFHDGYQYFENAFGIPAAGSVTVNDAQAPGAARVAEIRDRLETEQVLCIFNEPQFQPKLTATLIEGTPVRTGILDPIGADLTPGPDLYPVLITALADSILSCLEPEE